jgi:hypothetical protein
MRKYVLTPHRSCSTAITLDAACDIRRSCVTAIPKLPGWYCSVSRRERLGLIPDKESRNDISGLVVARASTARGSPDFAIPCNDGTVLVDTGALVHHEGGTEIFPSHLIPTRKLDAYRPTHGMRQERRIE